MGSTYMSKGELIRNAKPLSEAMESMKNDNKPVYCYTGGTLRFVVVVHCRLTVGTLIINIG